MKAIKNVFFMDSNFKKRSLQVMTIAVKKKWTITFFPIYVHVLKERCKQLAQYLSKVQLMTNVAWVHWQRTIKILLKTTSIQKLHAKEIYHQVLEDITTDGRTDNDENTMLPIFKSQGGGLKLNHIYELAEN